MKRIICAIWLVPVLFVCGCGPDNNEWKSRCLDFCTVFERCVPEQPAEAAQCRSSCDVFDDPGSAEEFEELFVCKETCVNEATAETECRCLLRPQDGGPDC